MKKIFVSSVFVAAFGMYAALSRAGVVPATMTTDPIAQAENTPIATVSEPTAAAAPPPAPAPVIASAVPRSARYGDDDEEGDDEEGEGRPLRRTATPVTAPIAPKTTTTPKASAPKATTPAPTQSGQYRSGTYTGSAADAYYGTVQVKAVISGGKIVDVQFLQYPNDQPESLRKSERAMPILRSEAISAQSANVDTVSGASETSAAFRESLAAALAQA